MKLKSLSLLLFLQSFIGCIVLPERLIPKITSVTNHKTLGQKPSVYIVPHYNLIIKGEEKEPFQTLQKSKSFTKHIENLTNKLRIFENCTFDPAMGMKADFTIQIDLQDSVGYNHKMRRVIATIVSELSLFLIPISTKNNFKLTARLLDKNRKEFKTYVYKDCGTVYIDILLLPVEFFSYFHSWDTTDNLIKHLYQDILNDSELEYTTIGSKPVGFNFMR